MLTHILYNADNGGGGGGYRSDGDAGAARTTTPAASTKTVIEETKKTTVETITDDQGKKPNDKPDDGTKTSSDKWLCALLIMVSAGIILRWDNPVSRWALEKVAPFIKSSYSRPGVVGKLLRVVCDIIVFAFGRERVEKATGLQWRSIGERVSESHSNTMLALKSPPGMLAWRS